LPPSSAKSAEEGGNVMAKGEQEGAAGRETLIAVRWRTGVGRLGRSDVFTRRIVGRFRHFVHRTERDRCDMEMPCGSVRAGPFCKRRSTKKVAGRGLVKGISPQPAWSPDQRSSPRSVCSWRLVVR
jgi:hypothetical protein